MNGFGDLVATRLRAAGVPADHVLRGASATLPGWFRPAKAWDLVVADPTDVRVVIEFKPQVGPSFGNNFNNRAEEALGSAVDLQLAARGRVLGRRIPPWMGMVVLVEHAPASTMPTRIVSPVRPVRPVFDGASYIQRWRVLLLELVAQRQYDAAVLVTADRADAHTGAYAEPDPMLGFERFFALLGASLVGRR